MTPPREVKLGSMTLASAMQRVKNLRMSSASVNFTQRMDNQSKWDTSAWNEANTVTAGNNTTNNSNQKKMSVSEAISTINEMLDFGDTKKNYRHFYTGKSYSRSFFKFVSIIFFKCSSSCF